MNLCYLIKQQQLEQQQQQQVWFDESPRDSCRGGCSTVVSLKDQVCIPEKFNIVNHHHHCNHHQTAPSMHHYQQQSSSNYQSPPSSLQPASNNTTQFSLWQLYDLPGHEAELPVLVKHRVQVLDPFRINLVIVFNISTWEPSFLVFLKTNSLGRRKSTISTPLATCWKSFCNKKKW